MTTDDRNGHDTTPTSARRVPAEPAYATAAALAGLARQVETLRRDLARDSARAGEQAAERAAEQAAAIAAATASATATVRRVTEVAGVVARLADVVAGIKSNVVPVAPVSWLQPTPLVDGSREPLLVLTELCAWVARVYLRYRDARALVPCWLWHSDVVEELCWLHQAWGAAYLGATASVQAAGDWHDRQRPGVARRIRDSYTKGCSIEVHQSPPPLVPESAPLASAAAAVAAWMSAGHTATPPAPTAEQVREAAAVHAQHRTGRSHQ